MVRALVVQELLRCGCRGIWRNVGHLLQNANHSRVCLRHAFCRWLRSSSDIFFTGLLDDLLKDSSLKVKVFYTRQLDASASSNSPLGDDSHVSAISLGAGKGRVARASILEGVGEHMAAALAEAVCLISGPPGDVRVCL